MNVWIPNRFVSRFPMIMTILFPVPFSNVLTSLDHFKHKIKELFCIKQFSLMDCSKPGSNFSGSLNRFVQKMFSFCLCIKKSSLAKQDKLVRYLNSCPVTIPLPDTKWPLEYWTSSLFGCLLYNKNKTGCAQFQDCCKLAENNVLKI